MALTINCSFCGKDEGQVQIIVIAHDVTEAVGRELKGAICTECMELHLQLIAADKPELFEKLIASAKAFVREAPQP
jgi:hypothetical protein